VCQDVQTTGAGNCTHDGVRCDGCGSCCSRNCGPWALTGVNVCQRSVRGQRLRQRPARL
jgi:hypothetical protein